MSICVIISCWAPLNKSSVNELASYSAIFVDATNSWYMIIATLTSLSSLLLVPAVLLLYDSFVALTDSLVLHSTAQQELAVQKWGKLIELCRLVSSLLARGFTLAVSFLYLICYCFYHLYSLINRLFMQIPCMLHTGVVLRLGTISCIFYGNITCYNNSC